MQYQKLQEFGYGHIITIKLELKVISTKFVTSSGYLLALSVISKMYKPMICFLIIIWLCVPISCIKNSVFNTISCDDFLLKDYAMLLVTNTHHNFILILLPYVDSNTLSESSQAEEINVNNSNVELSLLAVPDSIAIIPKYTLEHIPDGVTMCYEYKKRLKPYYIQKTDTKCKLVLPYFFSPDVHYINGKLYYRKKG